jgi:NAD(P)-dependent dehydrogenase (short-subunit alcohol dehydrogenase family)
VCDVPLDLGSQASIQSWSYSVESHLSREAVAGTGSLHALVHHAGVMGLGLYTETIDGEEMQWATNYSGLFRLTQCLWAPLLKYNARRDGTSFATPNPGV